MIFVDTNVFMYAVGKPHPLRSRARDFFTGSIQNVEPLCTSAEVLQELMHAYLPVRRSDVFDDALALIGRAEVEVWPLEEADVILARQLHSAHPTLGGQRPLPPGKLPAARREPDHDLRPNVRRCSRLKLAGKPV